MPISVNLERTRLLPGANVTINEYTNGRLVIASPLGGDPLIRESRPSADIKLNGTSATVQIRGRKPEQDVRFDYHPELILENYRASAPLPEDTNFRRSVPVDEELIFQVEMGNQPIPVPPLDPNARGIQVRATQIDNGRRPQHSIYTKGAYGVLETEFLEHPYIALRTKEKHWVAALRSRSKAGEVIADTLHQIPGLSPRLEVLEETGAFPLITANIDPDRVIVTAEGPNTIHRIDLRRTGDTTDPDYAGFEGTISSGEREHPPIVDGEDYSTYNSIRRHGFTHIRLEHDQDAPVLRIDVHGY